MKQDAIGTEIKTVVNIYFNPAKCWPTYLNLIHYHLKLDSIIAYIALQVLQECYKNYL